MPSRRALLMCAPLAVIVAVSAGIEGTTDFTGARWFPHTARGTPPPQRLTSGGSSKEPLHSTFPYFLVILIVSIVIGIIALAIIIWYIHAFWPQITRYTKVKLGMLAPVPAVATAELAASEPPPSPPELRSGVEIALARLHEAREPADAVIRAWVGLEESAIESGITRRDAETPTEFTQRVMRQVAPDTAAVTTLLRLYLRTRFGDHPVTQAEVAAVRESLQALVRTWHGPDEPGGVA